MNQKINSTISFLFYMTTTVLAQNPFLTEYKTPHHTAPFNLIKAEHYETAMLKGMEEENKIVEEIINNPEPATFENTIIPYTQPGQLLENVCTVFFNLLSAETNDTLQDIAQKMSPKLTEHSNNITLNLKLFERIKTVYQTQKEDSTLEPEDRVLLQKIYDGFVRNGANLCKEDKERYKTISKELSQLTLIFSQNTLKEKNAYELHITNKNDITGLPISAMEMAHEVAKEKGKEGLIFTLDAPSYIPFMKFCENRNLRRQLYMAYNTVCLKGNEFDNQEIVRKIVNLRQEKAQLLGYQTHADYVLEQRMAANSENVYNLLNQLIEAYTPTAQKEYAEIEKLARKENGANFNVFPWDWSYYSEKLRKAQYDIDTEELRPYFELNHVQDGVFGLATRLYGITFHQNQEIPVYHPDVKAYEVLDKDGTFLAVLYTDYHPRAGKQSGAWMTEYKSEWKEKNGNISRPHVSITMNFTKPTADRPALLTLDEVQTFLHEFGHAIHGMMANTKHATLSGTSVFRDFVELPSQIMENWATEKEFLHTFARHYQTNELIPVELIKRIKAAENFNVAYACLRQVSFGLLDMAYYTLTHPLEGNIEDFEKQAWAKAQIMPKIPGTCMSVQFSHIMDGGYSAGYYGYKWAEVLDADAFELFQEQGLFDKTTAESFRKNILEKGATEHPMKLYKQFRGKEPSINALLKRNGIIEAKKEK